MVIRRSNAIISARNKRGASSHYGMSANWDKYGTFKMSVCIMCNVQVYTIMFVYIILYTLYYILIQIYKGEGMTVCMYVGICVCVMYVNRTAIQVFIWSLNSKQ